MRVLLAGTFDRDFARNRLIESLLYRAGVDVDVVHRPVWGGERFGLLDRPKVRLALRAANAYASLFVALLRAERPDVIVVLHPGQLDMPIVAAAARLRRVPVILDAFISLYDTVVVDRRLRSSRSLTARALRLADRLACRTANRVLVDTPQNGDFLANLTGLPREHFEVLWVGAPEAVFHPLLEEQPDPNHVLFYGTYIPLQGIDTIIRAAKLLESTKLRFQLVGNGQERPAIERLVRELSVSNVELTDSVPLEQLPNIIASASLCLGIFGTTDKAARVVPNKVFQCLAVGRPVLTGDTPAIRTALSDAVAIVPPGDAEALARTIGDLLDDPARLEALASRGKAAYDESYGESPLAELLSAVITATVARRRPR